MIAHVDRRRFASKPLCTQVSDGVLCVHSSVWSCPKSSVRHRGYVRDVEPTAMALEDLLVSTSRG